jgi:serine protease Do
MSPPRHSVSSKIHAGTNLMSLSPRPRVPASPRHVLVALLACAITAVPAATADTGEAFRKAAGRAAPSVVTIETIGGTQPTSNSRSPTFLVADGPTTGLVWSADGLILTSSFNFVRDPSVITVTLADGRRFVAELLGRDEIRRLAMLKIDASDLPVPEWADIAQMKVGQWAIGLGRGFGQLPREVVQTTGGCTITAGIISGLGRMSRLVIQTDAKLSPANFGGPLIDIEGRVLGLCVPIGMDPGQLSGVEWYDSGIGFAVPRQQVQRSAPDLARGRNVRRGILGVGVAQGVPGATVVGACGDPSPALRAGVEPGDQIVAIDDQPIETYADLTRILRPYAAGTRVIVHIMREGKPLELPLILAVPEDVGPVTVPEPPASQPTDQPLPLPWDEEPAIVPPATGPS